MSKKISRLTPEKCSEIIELRNKDPAKWTYERLAALVGCAPSIAWDVCNWEKKIRGNRPKRMTDDHIRQRILNFVQLNPGCLTGDVCKEFNTYNEDGIGRNIREMAQADELVRTRSGSGMYSLKALTDIAMRPEVIRNRSKKIKSVDEPKQETEEHGNFTDNLTSPTTVIGEKTIHLGSRRENPLSSQGGQGAVRSRVYVGSSAGMI